MITDTVGDSHGTPNATVTLGTTGALLNAAGTGATTTAAGQVITTTAETAPTTLTVEAWVKTTSTRGGRIVGFGDQVGTAGASVITDRVLYLDTSGRPNFMINDTAMRTVTARSGINDGNWHHVAGTVDGSGCQLLR